MNWYPVLYRGAQEFPKFKVVAKDNSKFMRFLAKLLWPINREFMDGYITTIGYTVYMPRDLFNTPEGTDTLRHELVHVRQYDRFKLWFMVSYLIFPLPVIFTMRAYWEYQAYKESLRATHERFGSLGDADIEWVVEQFTSSAYGWMFPFRGLLTRWLNKFAGKLDGR